MRILAVAALLAGCEHWFSDYDHVRVVRVEDRPAAIEKLEKRLEEQKCEFLGGVSASSNYFWAQDGNVGSLEFELRRRTSDLGGNTVHTVGRVAGVLGAYSMSGSAYKCPAPYVDEVPVK